ncbi:hypothetical protein BX600DRAFT_514740 [Xylariales sp. PMI_506]|nr:hypothetical protein BX600DRAFT_514740 [Xylariales sp. PMI_506]
MEMQAHKPTSFFQADNTKKALSLLLKAGISIANSDLKAAGGNSTQTLPKGTLKVIIAGLPRTGTMSMKMALEELGYKNCFHLAEPLCQFENLRRSADIVNTKDTTRRRRKLAQLFNGCEATLEVPGSACLPDLLTMYPDAKVILTERTSARVWLKSWHGFGIDLRSDRFRWVGYWVPGVVATNELYRGWMRLSSERFGLPAEPSEELYHAHSKWVKSIVPAERLLVFKCQDGWDPLCNFLGRQRPNLFPHGNESSHLKYYKRVAMLLGIFLWLLVLALPFATMTAVTRNPWL